MAKRKKNRELLLEAFPAAYVEHGLNATKAYKAIKTKASYETARVEGSKALAIPSIQERIRALLPSEEVEARVINEALSTEVKREMNWSEKHKYLETSLKLKGLLKHNDSDKSSVQVGIIIER